MDILQFVNQVLIEVPAIAAFTVVVSEFISKYITKTDGLWAQIQSWVVAILILYFAQYIEVAKAFMGFEWYIKVMVGVITGFVANGLFDLGIIKKLLEILNIRY